MKSIASKLFTLFVFALLCTAAFPPSAMARQVIKYRTQHVYLDNAGEARIVGGFENTGDQGGYVKHMEMDLQLVAGNGQEMWSGQGLYIEGQDIYVPAGEYVEHDFYIYDEGLPEYHQEYRWKVHFVTHSDRFAG